MIHYTYLWLRRDGTPYYAGKGKGIRAFTTYSHRVKCPTDPERIIVQEWPSHEVALEAERFLVAVYGRKDNGTGCLRNLTDGGEGVANLAAETRRKIGRAAVIRQASPEVRRRLSERAKGNKYCLGRKRSETTRAKLSRAMKRRMDALTPEERTALAKKGRAGLPRECLNKGMAARARWWASPAGQARKKLLRKRFTGNLLRLGLEPHNKRRRYGGEAQVALPFRGGAHD